MTFSVVILKTNMAPSNKDQNLDLTYSCGGFIRMLFLHPGGVKPTFPTQHHIDSCR